ncbi:TerD family protein, partial [Streptomyces sp. NRRL F-3273]|uniref:TerD family protein n=1 Tax=Streptomyces sp. NRRL F-3273 TaxID=1463848 RepID=UPI00051711DB
LSGLRLVLLEAATGDELARFAMDAGTETAFVRGELYRRAGGWKFRAVDQGYASGLAGLATDFGITVDEEPEPQPAAAPRPPEPASPQGRRPRPERPARPRVAPHLVKGEKHLPVDMRKRLSLRKEQVAVSLP